MYSFITGPCKSIVKRMYPMSKDIRINLQMGNCIEIWSEGIQKGFLLARGTSRAEAWFKAAESIKNE